MDQSICLLAEQGKAKMIHFNPLKTETVTLPADAKFVVAHSLTKKEKALSNGEFSIYIRVRIKLLWYSNVSYFPDRILMEHIEYICKLESKPFFMPICFIRIRSRK